MGRTIRNRKRMFDDDDYSDYSRTNKKKQKISQERRQRKSKHHNYEDLSTKDKADNFYDDYE